MSTKFEYVYPMCVPGEPTKIRLLAVDSFGNSIVSKWAVVTTNESWARSLARAFDKYVHPQTLLGLINNRDDIIESLREGRGGMIIGPDGMMNFWHAK